MEKTHTQGSSIQPTLPERFEKMTETAKNVKNQSSTPKIQKVIFLLRDNDKDLVKYYEPRVVSLGPIHYRNPKYQLGEKYKFVLACEFIEASGKTKEEVYNKIKEKIDELRKCFEEEVTKEYDDEELTWLLFVDGCAILQFIYCTANDDEFEGLNIKNDSVAFGHQDLLLLENQLPYRLLKWLMSLSEKKKELEKSIEDFIKVHHQVPDDQQSCFLDWCCLKWLPSFLWKRSKRRQEEFEKKESSLSRNKPQEQTISVEGEPIHLLDLLRTRFLANHDGQRVPKINRKKRKELNWQSYRNVQELQAAGIHLKRSQNSCLSLCDLSFTTLFWCFGFLWLPPLIVDDSTGPKFFNLIAYEMCPDFHNDYEVSSYISFLDSLIDEVNDVKELRKAGVLYNLLGSDQEVAELFNEIGTDLVPNTQIYSYVRSEIQKYYKNKCLTWITQALHEHFSSPWTIIAFLGALLALALTVVQTWYTVDSPPGPCEDTCKNLTRILTSKR